LSTLYLTNVPSHSVILCARDISLDLWDDKLNQWHRDEQQHDHQVSIHPISSEL
jgi:hypothetical protein